MNSDMAGQGQGMRMKEFFPELLDSFSGMDFIGSVCEKYHYDERDLRQLQAVAEEMLSLMRGEACWEVCSQWEEAVGETDAVCEGVVITLGVSLDRLQDSYHEKGLLTESYMLEVLASELLLQSYRAYNRFVRETGGVHVARYHFPGSEKNLPLEMLPNILNRFSIPVSCNEAFCMLPKKSVVFLAELTRDEKVQCEGICVGCGNSRCSNRIEEGVRMERMSADMPLTYGYRRIFGKW